MFDNTIKKKFFFSHFFVHPSSHLLRRVNKASIQLSPKSQMLQKKSFSRNVIHNTLVGSQMRLLKIVFKADLRPKLHSCFYGVFLILWRKTLEQSFLTFSSDFAKVCSSNVWNSMQVTSFPRMYKTFLSWFYLLFHLVSLRKSFL